MNTSGTFERVNYVGQNDWEAKQEVPLYKLTAGQRLVFVLHVAHKRYYATLLAKSSGTARVRVDGAREATYWSLSTPVVPINEFVEGEALQALSHTASKQAGGSTASKGEQDMSPKQAVALPGVGASRKAATASQTAKANAAKRKTAKPKVERAPKQLNECMCGCGEMVGGRFKMGHDARYHGWLGKLAAGLTIEQVNAKSAHAVSAAVKTALKQQGGTLQQAAKALLRAH